MYPRIRLFVDTPLASGSTITLEHKEAHYLTAVMRLNKGDAIALFNGRDGEWRAEIGAGTKKTLSVHPREQLKPQMSGPDIALLFAPIKQGRIDWLVEKATELGVSAFYPVMTKRTQASRLPEDRLRAHAKEAAEQCERLDLPRFYPLKPLTSWLEGWDPARKLFFCDETGNAEPAPKALANAQGPIAILIGPEGGFDPGELDFLRRLPYATGMTLGPRVLRADTAALAALSVALAVTGEWSNPPRFAG